MTNKIFQARFNDPEVLERYLSPDECAAISKTFCDQTQLSDWNNPLISDAKLNPSKYCLKALREGGCGENLFGQEIIPILEKAETHHDLRAKYVLMKIIVAEQHENTLVRCGQVARGATVSEFGITGIYLHDVINDKILVNCVGGHLVRTKPAESMTGTCKLGAVLSSVCLVNS